MTHDGANTAVLWINRETSSSMTSRGVMTTTTSSDPDIPRGQEQADSATFEGGSPTSSAKPSGLVGGGPQGCSSRGSSGGSSVKVSLGEVQTKAFLSSLGFHRSILMEEDPLQGDDRRSSRAAVAPNV